MTVPYTLTSFIVALLAAGTIFFLVRRNLVHASYAIWWIGAGVVIALAGAFPRALDWIGVTLGVSYPPTLFLTLAALALAVRLLLADISRTRMEMHLRRMALKQARLAHRVIKLEKMLAGKDVKTVPLPYNNEAKGEPQSPPQDPLAP